MFDFNNVTSNDGFLITIGGILLVFFGLVLINLAVLLMNYIFSLGEKKKKKEEPAHTPIEPKEEKNEIIPPEHIAVIFAAVELYRRLHFDIPKSTITVRRSEGANNSWKTGQIFGQRS